MDTGKRRKRGQATRSDIIEVGRRLFSDYGYHHTGISDIQSATGLTKGALYHHFRAKEDLALAILAAAETDYVEKLIDPAMSRPTPGERLAALIDGVCTLNAQPQWRNGQLMTVLSAELTSGDGAIADKVRSMKREFIELWQRAVEDAQQAGEAVKEPEAAFWAELIESAVTGALAARKIGAAGMDLPVLLGQLKRMLMPHGPG